MDSKTVGVQSPHSIAAAAAVSATPVPSSSAARATGLVSGLSSINAATSVQQTARNGIQQQIDKLYVLIVQRFRSLLCLTDCLPCLFVCRSKCATASRFSLPARQVLARYDRNSATAPRT